MSEQDWGTMDKMVLAYKACQLQARVDELEARLPHYHNEKQCGVIADRMFAAEIVVSVARWIQRRGHTCENLGSMSGCPYCRLIEAIPSCPEAE